MATLFNLVGFLLDPIGDAAHLVENFVGPVNRQACLDDAAHGSEHLADCLVHIVDRNAFAAGATEIALLCARMKSSARLLNLNVRC